MLAVFLLPDSLHEHGNGSLTNEVQLCRLLIEILQNLPLSETVGLEPLSYIVKAEILFLLILEEVGARLFNERCDGGPFVSRFFVPVLDNFKALLVWIIDVNGFLDDVVDQCRTLEF